MNKKIKIIDILNAIQNGEYENLPSSIEVDGKKYNWDTLEHFYNRKDSDREDLLELAREYDTITFLNMIAKVLDDNVEDNTEEIEELPDYNYSIKENRDKINELVRAINSIRKDKTND